MRRGHQLSDDVIHKIQLGLARDEREAAQCTSKKFFRIKEDAEKEVKKGIRERYLKPGAYSYKCDYCVGYHTTNGYRDWRNKL